MQLAALVCVLATVTLSTIGFASTHNDHASADLMPGALNHLSPQEANSKSDCYYLSSTILLVCKWYKNDKNIYTDFNFEATSFSLSSNFFPRKDVAQKSVLNVKSKAQTSQEERSLTIQLVSTNLKGRIENRSKIVWHSNPAHVLEGDAVQFDCTIFSTEHVYFTNWYMNGLEVDLPIEIISKKDAGLFKNEASTLSIKNVLRDDFGEEITCVLVINEGIIHSAAVKLTKKMQADVNYGLGIAIALSFLMAMMSILACIFHMRAKIEIPYTIM